MNCIWRGPYSALFVPEVTPNELNGDVTNGEMQPCRAEPEGTVLALHVTPPTVAPALMYCEWVPLTDVMIWWLSRLKASAVNCMCMLSWIGISRATRKSMLLN